MKFNVQDINEFDYNPISNYLKSCVNPMQRRAHDFKGAGGVGEGEVPLIMKRA